MDTKRAKFINKILTRIEAIKLPIDPLSMASKLNACAPLLDMKRLAEADDFNMVHDIIGIERYYDPKAHEFRDCFLPRFHKQPRTPAEG